MELIAYGVLGLAVVVLGLVLLVFGGRQMNAQDVSDRITDYVVEDQQKRVRVASALEVPGREFSGSLVSRVITPRINRVGQVLMRLSPRGAIEAAERNLMIAGNPMGMTPVGFFVMRFLFAMFGIALGLLLLAGGLTRNNILLAALAFLVSFLIPPLWLLSSMRRRQEEIRRALPDALDMLSVCASAGLGFDQSLQRVSEHWRTAIGNEFGRVVQEMSMGLTRAEALKSLAERVDVMELSTFVTLILQSEQLGIGVSDSLHSQADQMRLYRRFRAEEQIRKIPTKMLLPMTFLIFPAILAVLLGPAIPVLLDFFANF